MPNTPKKTCKAVKREGQGGARIHPKGCQIRTEVKKDGRVIRINKAGQRKFKRKETGATHFIFAAQTPNTPRRNWVKLVYDTGAQTTLMSRADATKLGYNRWHCAFCMADGEDDKLSLPSSLSVRS